MESIRTEDGRSSHIRYVENVPAGIRQAMRSKEVKCVNTQDRYGLDYSRLNAALEEWQNGM